MPEAVSEWDSPGVGADGVRNTVVWRCDDDIGMIRGERVVAHQYEIERLPNRYKIVPEMNVWFMTVQSTGFPADGWGGRTVSMFMHLSFHPREALYFPALTMTPQGLTTGMSYNASGPAFYVYKSSWIGPSRLWDAARSPERWDRVVSMFA